MRDRANQPGFLFAASKSHGEERSPEIVWGQLYRQIRVGTGAFARPAERSEAYLAWAFADRKRFSQRPCDIRH